MIGKAIVSSNTCAMTPTSGIRKMSCSFAANVNSQDSFHVLSNVIYIVTQEVTSYEYFIHEAGSQYRKVRNNK